MYAIRLADGSPKGGPLVVLGQATHPNATADVGRWQPLEDLARGRRVRRPTRADELALGVEQPEGGEAHEAGVRVPSRPHASPCNPCKRVQARAERFCGLRRRIRPTAA